MSVSSLWVFVSHPWLAHLCVHTAGLLHGGDRRSLLPGALACGWQSAMQAVGESVESEKELVHQALKLLKVIILKNRKEKDMTSVH